MTAHEHDYREVLSRAMHAAVDPVEPSPEGLSQIRRKLAEPWLVRQWRLLLSDCLDLAWLAIIRLRPVAARAWADLAARSRALPGPVAAAAGAVARPWASRPLASHRVARPARYQAAHRARQPASGQQLRLRAALTWLRPALAVAAVILIITVGFIAVGQFRSDMNQIGLITGSGVNPPSLAVLAPPHSHSRHHSRRQHRGTALSATPEPSSPRPSPSCVAVPAASSSPSPKISISPSPSVTPSASPTPSVTPSPTTTASPGSAPSLASTPRTTGTMKRAVKHRRRRCA